jgi:F0F1-type ATP synthase assembly protein I
VLSLAMLDPRKWEYQNQVGLLVSTIAGAGFGIVIGYQSNGWLGTLIWALISAVILGGAFYFNRVVRWR